MLYRECEICEIIFEIGERGRSNKRFCSYPCFLEHTRIKTKELRDLSKEIGNCPSCFRPNEENSKYVWCLKCREKNRGYQKDHKKRKKRNI